MQSNVELAYTSHATMQVIQAMLKISNGPSVPKWA